MGFERCGAGEKDGDREGWGGGLVKRIIIVYPLYHCLTGMTH